MLEFIERWLGTIAVTYLIVIFATAFLSLTALIIVTFAPITILIAIVIGNLLRDEWRRNLSKDS